MLGAVYEGFGRLSMVTPDVVKLLEKRVVDIEVVEALSNLWRQA
jgi:hypothetical protein